MTSPSNELPVISCTNCGVCCFHMGYPAFIMPADPMSESEIESDPELAKLSQKRKQELRAGNPGEPLWHTLPDDLKQELLEHMKDYKRPDYDGTLESFDGPCIWLDMETRMCKHHTVRPNVCRDFETGSKECLDWRNVYQEKIL